MKFTTYGQALAKAEPVPAPHPLGGATAHMHACSHDSGTEIVLTGKDSRGKSFRMTAKSVYAAYMKMEAAWGLNRAWHVREDGTRKLVIVR